MCGIAFKYSSGQNQASLYDQMNLALSSMHHRGPDDSGILVEKYCAIGQCRLAIIDIEKSQQPMTDESKRYTFAYNGETYNYVQLRKELADRWPFRTSGDTETVMAGLILEGPMFLNKMHGMWALALWDKQEKTLFLARDRMGKKPLYYKVLDKNNRQISCASELGALFKLSGKDCQEDLDSIADYLRYGFYLPGTTIYQDVQEVLPGHYVEWSPDVSVRKQVYWRINMRRFEGKKKDACEMLKGKLITAVEKRLVSDVEVGAFLSGGIDSSIVVGILGQYLNVHPKTFSIGFTVADFDERQYARVVADKYRADHFEKVVSLDDSEELINLVLKHVGQPFADSSLLPSSAVAELASKHVKVALSGDGADELFSGYSRYKARTFFRWYSRLPARLRRNMGKIIRAVPDSSFAGCRQLLKKANLFLDIEKRHLDENPYVSSLMYTQDHFKELTPELAHKGHRPPKLPDITHLDDLHNMMLADAIVYLPQDNLLKVDRTSMAHSLEVRAPFIDHEIVEFAFSLPSHWHRQGGVGKKMLRNSFQSLLPRQLWHRQKQGFAVPVHTWFRQGLESKLMDFLQLADGYLNIDFVKKMIREHSSVTHDHGYRLWNIFVFLLWKHSFRARV